MTRRLVPNFICGPAILVIAGLSCFAADPRQPELDRLIDDALIAWDVPGAAVVVVNRERVLHLAGYGVRERGRADPVTPDTLFPLSSCTKAFTSTLLAILADDGKLAWDDPVRKHLPDFRLADPVADVDARLRDLLTHRTGVGSHDLLWYHSRVPFADQVRRLRYLPGEYPFRGGFAYQSVMFTAAGLAAGRAGGEPWGEQLRARILTPLRMTATRLTSPPADVERATPHRDGPIAWYEQPEPNAAGSIHAPARNLAAWLRFQLGDGTFHGQRLVSATNFAETHAPHVALRPDGLTAAEHPDTRLMSYALGWVVQDYRGELIRSHAGLIDGFRAHVAVAPRLGVGVAVLSNRHGTRMNLAVVNAVFDRAMRLPPRDWNGYLLGVTRRAEELAAGQRAEFDKQRGPMRRPLADYAGEYHHPAIGALRLAVDGDKLRVTVGAVAFDAEPHHGDVFRGDSELAGSPVVEVKFGPGSRRSAAAFGLEFTRPE